MQPLVSHVQRAGELPLPEDEVHVYYLRSSAAGGSERCLRLLSAAERERHRRFQFDKDRWIFLVAHAMKRAVLARYMGGNPEGLEFDHNAYGKPRVRARTGQPRPGFSLSHTDGMIALAVAHEPEVGVDVEDTRRHGDWTGLAASVLTSAEQDGLSNLDSGDRQRRFFELWTLKEAYIKARGMGLSLPLEGVSIRIPENGPIGAEFGAAIADDPAQWQFELFAIAAFRIAVAVRAGNRQKRTVRLLAGEMGIPL